MDCRGKHLIIAVTLTALDVAVASRYGIVIWQAYAGVIWSRLLLLLLTGIWATSLAALWSRVYGQRRQRLSPILSLPDDLKEEGHV